MLAESTSGEGYIVEESGRDGVRGDAFKDFFIIRSIHECNFLADAV
jgi:hypothetical protein